jgi:ssDNA-binding Zn-finger/Zn-ribbon topoisomerase 1
MSATAVCEEQVQVRRERRPCATPGAAALGQLLTRAHEAAHTYGAADCPVCGGTLAAHAVEARCDDCGSRLS